MAALGERCKLPQRDPGLSPGRKRILEHFPAKKRIWSLVAAILSLNGAKNNPKIVTKIRAVRPKGGGSRTSPPPLNTPLIVTKTVRLLLPEALFYCTFPDMFQFVEKLVQMYCKPY